VAWIGAGNFALGLYGFVATLQSERNFGRILAAYGGVFVAGCQRSLPSGRRLRAARVRGWRGTN
jgi:drug/metabolite transporter superfamily protein YnfA